MEETGPDVCLAAGRHIFGVVVVFPLRDRKHCGIGFGNGDQSLHSIYWQNNPELVAGNSVLFCNTGRSRWRQQKGEIARYGCCVSWSCLLFIIICISNFFSKKVMVNNIYQRRLSAGNTISRNICLLSVQIKFLQSPCIDELFQLTQ